MWPGWAIGNMGGVIMGGKPPCIIMPGIIPHGCIMGCSDGSSAGIDEDLSEPGSRGISPVVLVGVVCVCPFNPRTNPGDCPAACTPVCTSPALVPVPDPGATICVCLGPDPCSDVGTIACPVIGCAELV